MSKPKLLLHVCCAPCLSGVLPRLIDDYDVTAYFYNPNITEQEEYDLREKEMLRYLMQFNTTKGTAVAAITENFAPDSFLTLAKGLESAPEGGARCAKCFELRLKETLNVALLQHCDLFATTLTLSPHKNAALINEIGERLAASSAVKYLKSDFKKQDGYKLSLEMSKQYNLYRQNYCGCEYSKRS